MLEELTVLLTERTRCHPTPLEARARHQMPSFFLQLQDTRGHARSPRNAKRAQSGSLIACNALRENKRAFVRGRPTVTAQDKGLNARREPAQGQKAGVVTATSLCDLTCSLVGQPGSRIRVLSQVKETKTLQGKIKVFP